MPSSPPSSACACCGHGDWTLLGRKDGVFIPQEYSYWRCTSCGFSRVEPFAGYGIYNEDYYSGKGADPFVNYAEEYADYRQTDRELEFADLEGIVRRRLADSAATGPVRWLDYGCGAGGFIKHLRAVGAMPTKGGSRPLSVAGHDVGSYADRLKADGFEILDFAALAAQSAASFEVISLVEVIEHIPDPGTVIATCARLLRPGGILLLTTGNFDCPVARRDGIHYRYCIPEIHVSLFSPTSLAALYRKHGLAPWTTRYDGAIKFKVLKSIPKRWRPLARAVLRLPGITRLIDRAYGVSLMPSAYRAP